MGRSHGKFNKKPTDLKASAGAIMLQANANRSSLTDLFLIWTFCARFPQTPSVFSVKRSRKQDLSRTPRSRLPGATGALVESPYSPQTYLRKCQQQIF